MRGTKHSSDSDSDIREILSILQRRTEDVERHAGGHGRSYLSAYPHIGEVSSDDAVIFHDGFPIEDDVLRAAENGLTTDFVPGSRLDVVRVIVK